MNILSTVKLPTVLKQQIESKFPTVTFYHDKKIDEALDILAEADILFTYGEDLTASHIQAATKLKWIMVGSAGIEKLPFDEIEKRGILVTNSKGVHAIPMAEYCLAMMLQVSRQSKALIENEKAHKWDRTVRMMELYGKTVYILGAGAIGQETAKLAQAFSMKVLGMNQDGRPVEYFQEMYTYKELKETIKEADFVISVLPSTEQTKGLLNYELFKEMKREAVFINIGRGDVVNEKDLLKVLDEGLISHAVLDVFEHEPLDEHHPFWDMENVTITPHLSGITKNYLPRVMPIFEDNLERFRNGELSMMRNIIDLRKQY
ncbi:D-2-hydroxyacid dehydrogenase [Metabacillus niabensis]|uniref:D-2-hydroxyacid dehydrogenase n=1 Tax=Metabacillus niabensis TaxID=324854 RepID=UPI00119FF159